MSDDVISLSSDSSMPSSPFITISEVLNDTEKFEALNVPLTVDNCNYDAPSETVTDFLSNKDKSIYSPTKDRITHMSIYSPTKDRITHTLSDSDNSEPDIMNNIIRPKELRFFREHIEERGILSTETKTSSSLLCNTYTRPTDTSRKFANTRKVESKTNIRMTKEQRLDEKLRKQQEKEKIKAEKLATRELQKQMKPGNCMKFITVIVDSTLVTCSFGGILIAAVQNSESKCQVSPQLVPFTISWTRELPGRSLKKENDVFLIWQWQLVIPAIKNHTLCLQVQDIQQQHPGKCISLVIYGLNGYFSYLKSKRRHYSDEPSKPKKGKRSTDNQDFPYVTRKDIEEELIELQIMAKCNHRLIESPEELGQLIVQITKAIAETPFKMDKQRRELENLEWFAVGDSRDCVTVNKDGNGLLRLWQQQLCQFNLAGHDIAQAIVAVYPSPYSIVQSSWATEGCGSLSFCRFSSLVTIRGLLAGRLAWTSGAASKWLTINAVHKKKLKNY